MIKLVNVNKYFNRRKRNEIHIINNTSLEMEKTGLVAILGHSGSGKTTLLNVIGGLDKVNKGKIYINGKKITNRRARTIDKIRNLNIGYIFQDYKLLENLSVYENVAISLKMIGIKNKEEIDKRVKYVLETVNMYRYRNRPAKMLSGGEKQRVSIARALVKNPNIVIADEPTGNLDSKNSLEIMNIIKAISKDKLVILVTHEVNLAKFYASRIIEIEDGKVTKDYKNEVTESLDYRIDNKIYLKDFNKINQINSNNINLDIYANEEENAQIKLIVKNGNIYIQSENKKIEIIDDNSAIELIDDHYKKLDKSVYEEHTYNLDNIIDKKHKPKYSSVYGLIKSIINGFKRISNYSVIKKILLIGFFASSMFIVYAVSNIAGTTNIEDSDFITKNKNYLQVEMSNINVDDFAKYENLESVDYILPGDSNVSFKIKFDDYYQTSRFILELKGSLTTINAINENDITIGRMPQNEYEIIVDKMVIDNMKNDNGMASFMGINSENDLLNKKVSIDNLKEFTIVGFTNLESPSIYAYNSVFINILNNEVKSDSMMGVFFDGEEEDTSQEKVMDYSLYMDDITLKKGKLPTEDYEVIVNIANKDEMKLNKTIKIKVNGQELKVVGYYESKTNKQNYYVSSNTVKYSVIEKAEGLAIYPKENKGITLNELVNQNSLNAFDSYEKDKQMYMKEHRESITSAVIFAGVILAISLIEIYLMIRSSFLSKIKEVGVLRAIGIKKKDIYMMFLGEILAITTVASVPGIILMSYILSGLKNIPYVSKMFIVNFTTVSISTLIIFGFNIIIGLLPLFKVLRKTPARILARNDLD